MVKKTYVRKRKRKQQPEEELPQGISVFVELPRIHNNCSEVKCEANQAMDLTNAGIDNNCTKAKCEAMDPSHLTNAAESSQHIQQNMQLSGEAICTSVNSLVKNVPCRQTSRRDVHKKGPDVGNGAKQKTARPRREQICEDITDISDSEIIPQQSLHCRGQSRRRSKNSELGKLDSETFDCYLEKIWAKFPEERKSLFTYLDSFWYYLYTNRTTKAKVLNWIKKKDIFSKPYVFVPMVQWGHWCLLIICNMGKSDQSKASTPCLLLLDSMQVAHAKDLEPGIRKFVSDIYSAGQTTEAKQMIRKIPFRIPKVPQQRDSEECGYYALYYITRFLELAPEDFSLSDGYPYSMKEDWFTPEELDSFCKELKSSPSKDSPEPVECSTYSGNLELQDCCIS